VKTAGADHGTIDTVTVQEFAYRGPLLAQQHRRRLRPGSDRAHPVEHTVTQPWYKPFRDQPGQRGDLHRHQRRSAQRHRKRADADR